MQAITTHELSRWLDGGREFLLLDVTPRVDFDRRHIPGAVNVCFDSEAFAERVRRLLGEDRASAVVVYGHDSASDATLRAARALERAGCRDVYYYRPGVAGWHATGHGVDSAPTAGA